MTNFSHLYQSYKVAMVRISVRTPDGDLSSGSAFHIGDGWLATAAHVVRDGAIEEVVGDRGQEVQINRVIFHSDERVDLALLQTDFELRQR